MAALAEIAADVAMLSEEVTETPSALLGAAAEPAAEDAEEWKVVRIAPAYAVSTHGRVRRVVSARTRRADTPLTPSPRRHGGYLAVNLRVGARGKTVFLHRLICEAFHGPQPTPDHEVAHFDGDRLNNAATNLRWATRIENAADKDRHGRIRRGDQHPARLGRQRILRGEEHWAKNKPDHIVRGEAIGTSKLTEEQVREIRSTPHFHGITVRLAEKYGVSNVLIGRILRGLQWGHVNA